MKKTLTSLAILLAVHAVDAQCTISNSGFESWSNDTIFNVDQTVAKTTEMPSTNPKHEWFDTGTLVSAFEYLIDDNPGYIDTLSVFKSSDKHNGNYALGIQVNPEIESAIVSYYTTCANISDRFEGYYKFSEDQDDTVEISCMYFSNGSTNIVAGGSLEINVGSVGWKKFSMPIVSYGGQADSVLITITLSGSKGAKSGAKLLLDDLEFKSGLAANTNELSANDLKVYPNPTSGNITITNLSEVNSQVNVLDVLGNTVLSTTMNSSNNSIDLSALPRGMYIIQINNENSIKSSSIILQQ